MTLATERIRAGRRPTQIVEIDCDYCTRLMPDYSDIVSAFNRNLVRDSEKLDDWSNIRCTATIDAMTPPSGVGSSWLITGDGIAQFFNNKQIPGGTLTNNLQYSTGGYFSQGTDSGNFSVGLYDAIAGTYRAYGELQWVAGVPTEVVLSTIGSVRVTSVGGGWYRVEAVCPAGVIVGANQHVFIFGQITISATTLYATGMTCLLGAAMTEYEFSENRDGTSTGVSLTTGGLTIGAVVGDRVAFPAGGTLYPVVRNGAGYVYITGDPTGSVNVSDPVYFGLTAGAGGFCTVARVVGSECYQTKPNCQALTSYNAGTKTYRFCQPDLNARLQVSIDAIPSLRSVSYSPTRITPGEGFGPRASLTCTFQDHPHHDRGIDPYESTRTYTPEDQGTYWGKWRTRNLYYQNRELRLLTGYITDPMDLTNNFETRTFVLDRFTGPAIDGQVTVTAKDILKLADDNRAQIPEANTGVLDTDITAVAGSLTLSPSGIGNSEYSASGTIRVGNECMTFTRVADVVTLTARGTDGTTAAAHSADDLAQECKRYSAETIDDIVYEMLVTYAGIGAGYITLADWTAQAEDWLSGHSVTALITEPTGVKTLLQELCTQYMFDLWWDDVDEKIRMRVLQPRLTTPDSITDASEILKGPIEVEDDPDLRVSAVYVRYDQIDPTKPLDDKANYRAGAGYGDLDAISATEYGESRIRIINSRWFSTLADASRLSTRTVLNNRDNRRSVSFSLDNREDYEIGDVIQVSTRGIQDAAGAADPVDAFVVAVSPERAGTTVRIECIEEKWAGRYGRISANGTADYSAATDEVKIKYGFICENSAPYLGGDGAYLIV